MITRLLKEEKGQTMVEYGLLIALISIAAIAALVLLGPQVAGFFDYVRTQLPVIGP